MANILDDLKDFELFGLSIQQLIIIVAAIILLIIFTIIFMVMKRKGKQSQGIEYNSHMINAFGQSTLSKMRPDRIFISVPMDGSKDRPKNWIRGLKK